MWRRPRRWGDLASDPLHGQLDSALHLLLELDEDMEAATQVGGRGSAAALAAAAAALCLEGLAHVCMRASAACPAPLRTTRGDDEKLIRASDRH